jgi:hypothetical protein
MVHDLTMRLVAVVGCALVLTACTSGATKVVDSSITRTETITPSAGATGPVDTRPVVAQDATDCPVLSFADAASMGGMRLSHVQVLKQGSATVGCRFYAISTGLAQSEHLHGEDVIEITSTRYATPLSAHNALALLADKGTDPAQYTIAPGIVGVAFRTAFDPVDGARDWAVAFAKASVLVVVHTATTVTSYNAVQIAQSIVGKY